MLLLYARVAKQVLTSSTTPSKKAHRWAFFISAQEFLSGVDFLQIVDRILNSVKKKEECSLKSRNLERKKLKINPESKSEEVNNDE